MNHISPSVAHIFTMYLNLNFKSKLYCKRQHVAIFIFVSMRVSVNL